MPAVDLAHLDVDPIIRLIPQETARKYQILPLSIWDENLTLAMANPTDIFALDSVTSITGYGVAQVVASEDSIMDALDKYY